MADTTLRPVSTVPQAGPLAGEIVAAGAVAGIIGALLMAIYGAIATSVKGLGFFAVPQMIGATFMRPEALLHPVALTLWGTLLHLLIGVGWGVLFSALLRRETSNGVALAAGLAYAIGIFLLMVFIIVPATNRVFADRTPMLRGSLFVMHLLFGAALGLTPMLRRRFAGTALPGRRAGPVAPVP